MSLDIPLNLLKTRTIEKEATEYLIACIKIKLSNCHPVEKPGLLEAILVIEQATRIANQSTNKRTGSIMIKKEKVKK